MARSIGMAADATVFRAVITKTHPDGETTTTLEGPYGAIGAARARVSFWTNYLADRDEDTGKATGTSRASGHVERGAVAWTPVDASGRVVAEDGLVSTGHRIEIAGSDGQIAVRLHFAFDPEMPEESHDEVVADLTNAIGALVPIRPQGDAR